MSHEPILPGPVPRRTPASPQPQAKAAPHQPQPVQQVFVSGINTKTTVRTALIFLLLVAVVAALPILGFITWIIGIPVLIITGILGIVALLHGDTGNGIVILVGTMLMPLWLFFAPILGTMVGIGVGSAGSGSVAEPEPAPMTWRERIAEAEREAASSLPEIPEPLTFPSLDPKPEPAAAPIEKPTPEAPAAIEPPAPKPKPKEPSPFPTKSRQWTAKDGRKMEASAISYAASTGKVTFRRIDGNFFDYDANNLSLEDQDLLDDLALKATMGSR